MVGMDVGANSDLLDGGVADASDDSSALLHLIVVSSSMNQRQRLHLCAQLRQTSLQL